MSNNFSAKETCEIKVIDRNTGDVVLCGNTYKNTEDYTDGFNKGYKEGHKDSEELYKNNIQVLKTALGGLLEAYLQKADNACYCDDFYDDDEEAQCSYCYAKEVLNKYK